MPRPPASFGCVLIAMLVGFCGCDYAPTIRPLKPSGGGGPSASAQRSEQKERSKEAAGNTDFAALRMKMVDEQLRRRDNLDALVFGTIGKKREITDTRVLDAMGKVPRHLFVPRDLMKLAYGDHPLPIGRGQTISQPYIVALMTQAVAVRPNARCLDIGTGSGYQAAVLAELACEVYSIEIVPELAESARLRLTDMGYKNVSVRAGDGYRGWPDKQPFDCIIVAAAPDHLPQPLVDQLAPGGRLVVPVGNFAQELLVVEKQVDGSIRQSRIESVRFVPMTGEAKTRKSNR